MSRYRKLCIYHTLDGLREGLSHFSGPSRAALLLALHPDDPIHVLDPQFLLDGHQPKLRELFIESVEWQGACPTPDKLRPYELCPYPDPQLTGLLAFGGSNRDVPFLMWFTEEHPDFCSTGPTRCWLEHAAAQLVLDLAANNDMRDSASGFVLQSYATHAVRDYIVDRRNSSVGLDTYLRVYPTLDTILGISHTREEGAWPRGALVFVEPMFLKHLDFLASFPRMEQPSLANLRHCRKLLQAVEETHRMLVSDGKTIVGITQDKLPPGSIIANFEGRHGFLYLDDELICSFADGAFQSTNRRANLVQLEEALLESRLSYDTQHALFRIVTDIVSCAQERKHGCTLVLDLRAIPRNLAGQTLHSPLDLTTKDGIELACSLAKVDGALHIGHDANLYGFACLLDGRAVPGENRARGARYNSAVRFTAANDDLIVIVVSSDRPVSIIQRGMELTARCSWTPLPGRAPEPPTLEEWLKL
ncbi:DNA integrity scanning protein DisA nucleotide-binding domain protein [Desulfovibrio mangrovi]|uniref:DNA integrity scanning protein DisA nucleotide-binding domain protein n=1 Tax=Desulfovibrio mangrovi TaxID=2976983 RepID=UPI0022470BC9|nr:DNA integrity scanning protein DisA nucleotide-binding domain protein [Desulfovibrio mangrovi]UZP68901.1 DNA integrity scanning protein DisA nucleotide-binding domain protein [Desulfovibrio mangrovi]